MYAAVEAGDPSGLVGTWWPVVAIVLPFLQAAVQHEEARKYLKQGLSVIFALGAVIVTGLGMDWEAITAEEIAGRIVVLWGGAQATFWLVRGLVGDPGAWMFPGSGLDKPKYL